MDLADRSARLSWLRSLESDPVALVRLCGEEGLARAAWSIATARCGKAGGVLPTRRVLRTVARELAVRVGFFDALPTESRLAAECAKQGLPLAA